MAKRVLGARGVGNYLREAIIFKKSGKGGNYSRAAIIQEMATIQGNMVFQNWDNSTYGNCKEMLSSTSTHNIHIIFLNSTEAKSSPSHSCKPKDIIFYFTST